MEIQFKLFNGGVYQICIGRETEWFAQPCFIVCYRLWYDNMDVSYAEIKWSLF